jgi:hypothetical protein
LSGRCDCKKIKEQQRPCDKCVSRARAVILQEALALANVEHVLKKRTLRDHLEHFDERLDHWQKTSINKNIFQDYIGPKGGVVGIDDADMMRQLDPTTGEFLFRGETYNLIHLADGAKDILGRTNQILIKEGIQLA